MLGLSLTSHVQHITVPQYNWWWLILFPYHSTPVCAALSNGALRLVNTRSTRFGGRLEFYYDSKWGTVCDDGWDSTDAAVACRQMGFLGVSNSDSSQFGSGTSSQTIWLDNVVCSGSESRLIDCPHADLGNDICVHSEDVGIVCTNEIGEAWMHVILVRSRL